MDLLGNFYGINDEFNRRQRKRYKFLPRENNWTKWGEDKFFQRFRISKRSATFVLSKIEADIKPKVVTIRAHDLTAQDKLLLTLRFYATGSMLITVGDFIGVSIMTASRVVREVSIAIAKLKKEFIKFPNNAPQMRNCCTQFFKIAKFPRCCGAIDCTHVKIRRPVGGLGEIYRNRKGYFSMNVQTISDSNMKVMDIVARWPGSTHDSTIFHNSRIKAFLQSSEFKNYHIVGDKGYALKTYLLTPLQNPSSQPEILYNESIIRTRNVVERQYGVMKRRFPVLALGMSLKIDTIQAVIVACAVLHNIACEANENVPEIPSHVREEVENDILLHRSFDIERHFENNHNRSFRTESEKNKYYRQTLINNFANL